MDRYERKTNYGLDIYEVNASTTRVYIKKIKW